MRITSFIDVETWDQASWTGALFAVDPEGGAPPAMGLYFRDEAAGRKIFRDWIGRIGRDDEFDLLRVSIIEGDIPAEPPGYSVFLGTDVENYAAYARDQDIDVFQEDYLGVVGRYRRMTPSPGSPHLPAFKASYERHGSYQLIPAYGGEGNPTADFDLAIKKKRIRLLRADRLAENDMERIVLEGSS
jgi:hypothetical protein